MSLSRTELARLVDIPNGTISREIFVNQDIYAQEMEQIFSRAWLLVGHESQVPNPGDFVQSQMGDDSVIVSRDRTGEIHVFLNTCTHRGMKVCRYDQGNTRAFTCPYHGWSFASDGKLVKVPGELVGVPGFQEYYHGELDKEKWGLKRVAQKINYKGSIWATWDPNAPSLVEYLGDMRLYVDALLDNRDGSEGGSEMIGGVQKWRVPCNWKFAPENFIGDAYHGISHRSVDMVGIAPDGKGRRDDEPGKVAISFPGYGHGCIGYVPFYEEPEYIERYAHDPEIRDYFREIHERRVSNLGDRKRVRSSASTVFPNTSFHGYQPRTIGSFHPRGPGEMEMWRIYLVDRDAPKSVKDMLRHFYLRYSGPGGLTESDDMENWGYATQASKGTMARRIPYNYQMGRGYARPIPGLAGGVEGGRTTEENARTFYARWLQFMQQHDWDQLMPGRAAMAATGQ